MKKIINKPEDFVAETLEGIIACYPGDYELKASGRGIVKKDIPDGKVAIVTGGGSGHLPLFLGYVGAGLADGCAVGNVFASPSAQVMYQVTQEVDRGAGVLYLFGNYGGDKMNFEIAAEMAEDDGIQTRTVRGNDDVVSASVEDSDKRRGIAGILFAYKIAGAASEKGMSLDEVYRVTQKAVDNIRSMGVAISSCTLPEVGKPSFEIAEDEMEIGMGIHGEPGIFRGKMQEADAVTEQLMDKILAEQIFAKGDRVAMLINGLGATPREELFIVGRKAHQILDGLGIAVHKTIVGEYATSFEMGGCSISLIRLDDELTELLDMPAYSPFMNTWK